MLRKLMLSLAAAAALAGCNPGGALQDICSDVGYWNGDGEYVTQPAPNCPVPDKETEIVLPDVGA